MSEILLIILINKINNLAWLIIALILYIITYY